MDDDTLRRLLVPALTAIVWGPVHWLVDRHRRKHAERDARLRAERDRLWRDRGRRLGRKVRSLLQ